MNKEQFWNIVNEVHSSTDPRNQKEVLAALRNRLRNLPSEEILEWKQIFSFYQDAARRNDLWAAGAAMGAHSSDDGFMDFRSWLISQGHDVYMSALKDPESLVSVNTDGQELNFEDYSGTVSHIALNRVRYVAIFEGTPIQPAEPVNVPSAASAFRWSYVLIPLGIVAAAGAGVGGALLVKHRKENADEEDATE